MLLKGFFVSAFATALLWQALAAGAAQLPRIPGLGSIQPATVNNEYRGSIEFVWYVQAPKAWNRQTWTAKVNPTGVECTGKSESFDNGQLQTTPLAGPGLFHITFDSARSQYTFEVACPTADHPHESSWTNTDSSYKQTGTEGKALKGSWSEPSDEDPVNGVTGNKTMTWDLCYRCTFPKP